MDQPALMMKLSNRGFTLSELMIAAGILAFVFASLLLVFINCILLNELNRNFTLAYTAVQDKMEEIKNTDFDNLDTLNGTDFDLSGFSSGNGQGKIEISDESSNLKRIRIIVCFKSRNRLIGDDINNCQSSPVELETLIVK